MKWCSFLLGLSGFGLAACTTYQGPPANPVERSLTWFSFLAGDDIRAACRPGAPDHYRFVYNAIYEVQIRSYELTPVPGGAQLEVRARGRSGAVRKFSFNNPFGPWELVQGRATLDNSQASAIVAAYARALAASPSMAGRNIDSNEYYWIVGACSGGKYSLNAFVDPRVDLNALEFPKLLLAHDDSGVPFRPAKFVQGFTDNVFTIRINRAGDDLSGRL